MRARQLKKKNENLKKIKCMLKRIRKQNKKNFALVLFFIAGLLGFFLVRLVIENRFNLPPSTLTNNVISYALSCGIVCALAGGFFEAITQSE